MRSQGRSACPPLFSVSLKLPIFPASLTEAWRQPWHASHLARSYGALKTSGQWAQALKRCTPFCQPRWTLPCCGVASLPPPTSPGFPRYHRSTSSPLALALPQLDSEQPAQAGSKGNDHAPWHCHLGLSKRTPFSRHPFQILTPIPVVKPETGTAILLTYRPSRTN